VTRKRWQGGTIAAPRDRLPLARVRAVGRVARRGGRRDGRRRDLGVELARRVDPRTRRRRRRRAAAAIGAVRRALFIVRLVERVALLLRA